MLRTRLIAGPRAGLVLSAVLATLMTIVGAAETFFEPLRVTATQPAPIALRLPPVAMRTADGDGQYHLVRAAPVIPRGTIIDDPSLAEYVALFEDARRPVRLGMLAGSWFVYLLIGIMMTTYL